MADADTAVNHVGTQISIYPSMFLFLVMHAHISITIDHPFAKSLIDRRSDNHNAESAISSDNYGRKLSTY